MRETQTTTVDAQGTVTAASTTVTPSPESSVEIATDAKGQPKLTVKVYHADPAAALATAVQLYREGRGALEGSGTC